MNLSEIKSSVLSGKKVYCRNENYEVIQNKLNEWLILSKMNGYSIGLTWDDNITLNDKESEFFTI